jgi:hypothetical protein
VLVELNLSHLFTFRHTSLNLHTYWWSRQKLDHLGMSEFRNPTTT